MAASVAAFIAVNRFGLGARPGELDEANADPKAWLAAQLAQPAAIPTVFAGLPASADVVLELRMLRQQIRTARAEPASKQLLPAHGKTTMPPAVPTAVPAPGAIGRFGREIYQRETAARILAQIQSRQPLIERLVAFWSNHFTVSIARPAVLGLVGAFEREAIRPHVTGRFHELLLAAVRHPAMLIYLDNAQSTGPDSRLGRARDLGLNENLARELLELHTLGVDGGYTQADVTQFARILTGWSIAGPREKNPGNFIFRRAMHEPGEKIFLGNRVPEAGEKEGLDALALLARHPSTARHIARQFAIHFIADDPPPAAIERFQQVFTETDGDLAALTRAAIDAPEAWDQPLAKVKSPNELVAASLRAVDAQMGHPGAEKAVLGALKGLGQLPFAAPSPAGWPDRADGWIGPDAVLERADYAVALSQRLGGRIEPTDLIETSLGPVATPALRQAVARAATFDDAVALILASPEFQRR